jgi:hypothetical protein
MRKSDTNYGMIIKIIIPCSKDLSIIDTAKSYLMLVGNSGNFKVRRKWNIIKKKKKKNL